MKAHWRTTLFVLGLMALVLAGVLVFTPSLSAPVSAGSEPPLSLNPCFTSPPAEPPPPSSQVAVPWKVAPKTPPIDANWPIIQKTVQTVTDRSGVTQTVTDIIRRNPSGSSAASPLASCSFDMSSSWERVSTAGGITQHLKNYYDRYRWSDPQHYVYAYWVSQTESWWNRTGTSWGLGRSDISWTFFGYDCSGVHRVYSSYGNVVPQWYNGGNETWHYYWNPTSGWPILTPQVQTSDYLATDLDTEYYQNGTLQGSVHTEIVWSP